MSVKDFASYLWNHKDRILIGVIVLVIAALYAPSIYGNWSRERAADKLKEEREQVAYTASVAGMLWVGASRDCAAIGIRDVEACSKYDGVLLQEKAAPMNAKMAMTKMHAYATSCQKFHPRDNCQGLIDRSIDLSSVKKAE